MLLLLSYCTKMVMPSTPRPGTKHGKNWAMKRILLTMTASLLVSNYLYIPVHDKLQLWQTNLKYSSGEFWPRAEPAANHSCKSRKVCKFRKTFREHKTHKCSKVCNTCHSPKTSKAKKGIHYRHNQGRRSSPRERKSHQAKKVINPYHFCIRSRTLVQPIERCFPPIVRVPRSIHPKA